MRKYILITLIVSLILINGCGKAENFDYNLPQGSSALKDTQAESGLKLIEETNLLKKYSIDCSEIKGIKPYLQYLKSEGESNTYYRVFIPRKEINYKNWEIGLHQKIVEEKLIQEGKQIKDSEAPCYFGRGIGQNINNLYCDGISFDCREISDNGEILSYPNIQIKTIFSIDKNKNMPSTYGEYKPLEEYTLISKECFIVYYK